MINSHIAHISDLMFIDGFNGVCDSIKIYHDIWKMLQGEYSENKVSIKYDGAPALVFGVDPTDNRFFVAKKSIFNKTPVFYKTIEEINQITDESLRNKFASVLVALSKLDIRDGIYQGDLLFSNKLTPEIVNSVESYSFQPNTIVYSSRTKSAIGERLANADIGIAVHTQYEGTIGNLTATPTDKIILPNSDNVFVADIEYVKPPQNVIRDDEISGMVLSMRSARRARNQLDPKVINTICSDTNLSKATTIFINSKIKSNVRSAPSSTADQYVQFIKSRFSGQSQKNIDTIDKVNRIHKRGIVQMFKMFDILENVKAVMLPIMNRRTEFDHYLRTKNGMINTGPEGYVVFDKTSNRNVKIVNRWEFSRSNFSNEFIKGWQK